MKFWSRKKKEQELDDEVRSHLEMSASDRVDRGESRDDANHSAQKEFGNVGLVKEVTRETWGLRWLENLFQDVRYGLRNFRRTPVIIAVAILSLALGIGANTAIFTLVDALVLRMLPVHKPEELVQVFHRGARAAELADNFTNPLWEELRNRQDVFSGVFAWGNDDFNLTRGGAAQIAKGIYASGNYFGTLGVQPAAGRLFTDADDRRGCAAAAVLGHGFWQSRYGASANAIGSTISLNQHPFQIIGVAAAGFHGVDVGKQFDIAIPICAAAILDGSEDRLNQRLQWWLSVIGRTRPGVTPEQLNARLAVLGPAIFAATAPEEFDPGTHRYYLEQTFVAVSSAGGVSALRERFALPLEILMSVVGFVLLIDCANVASLMLAQATVRNREIAVRKALGATRFRLIRQLLTECVLLSTAGAALGILFALWGSALLVSYISTTRNVVFLDLTPNARILGFTAAIAVLTGLLFGLLPAFRSTRVSLNAAMSGGASVDGGKRPRIRVGNWIVASQVALSLVLLITAGLFLRSMVKIVTQDVGFDSNDVLLVHANLEETGIAAEQYTATFQEIEKRLGALPGVVSAGQSFNTPISGMHWNGIVTFDLPDMPTGFDALVFFNFASPGYFDALRTPILAGRNISETDTRTSPAVAMVNMSFVGKFLPHRNPVGTYFRVEGQSPLAGRAIQIIGVVKDTKYRSLRETNYCIAYFPMTQIPAHGHQANFELRSAIAPESLISPAQNSIAGVNKDISLEFHTLASQLNASLTRERLLATLSGFFGALAILLAMIGLFGAMSYMVTQRQTEFGIRLALGAPPGSILRMVLRDVFVILLSGVIAGISISCFTVTLSEKLLFGMTPQDPVTWLSAIGILAAVALFAGFLPARRASRVDPMVALRYE